MTFVVTNPLPEIAHAVSLHNLDATVLHTDLAATACACQRILKVQPNMTGEFCSNCSGMMVRTGTCTTCTSCGETGGCG